MGGDFVPAPSGDSLQRLLQGRVLERLDLSAVAADEMVMMVPGRVRPLEPGHAVTEVDSLDEPELVEALEGPVDAREPDPGAAGPHAVADLVRGDATVLAIEELDHDAPGATAPSASGSHSGERAFRPARH